MATYGNRNIGYTPFFSQGMDSITSAVDAKRERGREKAVNEKAQMAYMGDAAALEELVLLDPEMAMKVEDQAAQRKKTERQTTTEKDAAFQKDTQQIMTQLSQFDTFEDAQALGTRMTDYLQQKYPDRSAAQGAPAEFTPETFLEIKTMMGGMNQGTPVGVPFRATTQRNGQTVPVMAQQTKLPNGGTVTTYLKDSDGQLITPAEYDTGMAADLAGSKEGGKVRGGADATIETAAPVAAATTQAAAAAEAQVELPAFVMQASDTINAIDGIRNDPALDAVTGLGGWVNPKKLIPGTDAYNFMQRAKQVQGKVFAQAYETLKGGGPITEIESAEAQKAIARMDTAQSKESYLEALDDFENSIRRAVEKMEKQSTGDFSYEPLRERSAAAAQYTRNNPAAPADAAAYNALPSGTFYRTPTGELKKKK